VEALIAITMLILVTVSSVGLMVAGYRAINYNAHSLTASWLAQECVNGVRGLRDTNWIRFSYDKDACWNMAGDNCDPGNAIKTNWAYKLSISPFSPPMLDEVGDGTLNALDLSDGGNNLDNDYLLTYQDLDNSTDFDGNNYNTDDKQFLGVPMLGITDYVEDSIFYRMVKTLAPTADCPAGQCLEAVCEVQWLEGSTMKKISLPVVITNYHLFQ